MQKLRLKRLFWKEHQGTEPLNRQSSNLKHIYRLSEVCIFFPVFYAVFTFIFKHFLLTLSNLLADWARLTMTTARHSASRCRGAMVTVARAVRSYTM